MVRPRIIFYSIWVVECWSSLHKYTSCPRLRANIVILNIDRASNNMGTYLATITILVLSVTCLCRVYLKLRQQNMNGTAKQGETSTLTISREPHEIRITNHGKIRHFVSFALKSLQVISRLFDFPITLISKVQWKENPQRPLIFHTFPSVRPLEPPAPSDSNIEVDEVEQLPKPQKLNASTATIPRLVTVVEIVKREYGKWAATRKTQDGKPVEDSMRMGLHQYNVLGCLEDLGIVPLQEQELDKSEQLRLALEGKNLCVSHFFLSCDSTYREWSAWSRSSLHIWKWPWVSTLNLSWKKVEPRKAGFVAGNGYLSWLDHRHQPPVPVKKTNAAKARERKRRKKISVQ